MKTLDLPMYRSYLWNILACSKGMKITLSMPGIAKISIATWKDVLRWNSWFFIATNARYMDVEFARALLSSVITMFGCVRMIVLVVCLFALFFGNRWVSKSSFKRPWKTLRDVLAITWKKNCNHNWTQSTTLLDEEENSLRDKRLRKCSFKQKSWKWTFKGINLFLDAWLQKPRRKGFQMSHIHHKILETTSSNLLLIFLRLERTRNIKKICNCNVWQNLNAKS